MGQREWTERDLDLLKAGDRKLVNEFETTVVRIAETVAHKHGMRRDDIPDFCRECVLALYGKVRQIRNIRALPGWLWTSIVRRAEAKKKGFEFASDLQGDDLPDASSDPAVMLTRHADLQQAMTCLPEIYQVVIQLHYLEGLSCREIADQLQVSIDTVKSRLRRGCAQLRHHLKRIDPEAYN